MDTSSKLHSTNTSKPMGETVNTSISTTSSSSISRSKEMENLSLEISKYPTDLLQRFLATNPSSSTKRTKSNDLKIGGQRDGEEDDEGLNLGLGLSLGGKFGVDKSHKLGLIRSSSIAGSIPLVRDREEDTVSPPPAAVSNLVRTSSLPLETEEEWRKRKEMQTLRRMEAKRRRSEKQRILKESGGCGGEEKVVDNLNFRGTRKFVGSSMVNPFGSSSPPNLEVKRRRSTFGSLQGFLMAQAQAQAQQGGSQGSGESQGGSSSGASELESKTNQGSSSCGEERSPASIHSLQERGSQDAIGSSGKKVESTQQPCGPEGESSSSMQPENADNKRREAGVSGIEDMPSVFTIGDGPNGRKVEGILYKYGKGEEVRIMCVCHGSFFSPVEFVKHAGGKVVEHPLRHIVVSPSSSAFR